MIGKPNSSTATARLHAIAVAAAIAAVPLVATAAELAVTVENLKAPDGTLRLALYASEADYRKTAVRLLQAVPEPGRVTVRFGDLAAGEYALAMYHDRNGNGKLDSNLVGIPTEPYGFSGDGSVIGAPGWREARIVVPAEGAAITVKLTD